MRVVVDTNVLVSALLTPGRTPDQCLAALHARGDTVLVDSRIEEEYRSVLARPKFATIDSVRARTVLETLLFHSERVVVTHPYEGPLIDNDDRFFVEVCLVGKAHAMVTGNAKHYPTTLGFEVLSPAMYLALTVS
jgi:uncharacterized protein